MSDRSDLRVLYVAGARRTGSTLFGRVAGSLPGAAITGEVRLVWAAIVERRPCTCLHPVGECPRWQPVSEAALKAAGEPVVTAADMFRIQSTVVRERRLPMVMRWRYGRHDELDHYARVTLALYEQVAAATGADVIVDSSKSPAYAAFLRRVPGLDVRFVHLVRDPVGVIESWSREKTWQQGEWSESLFARPPSRAAAEWVAMNLATEIALAHATRVRRVRFEDFQADPLATLQIVADLAGLPAQDPDGMSLDGRQFTVATHHEIAGNIDRFATGPVAVRPPTPRERSTRRDVSVLTAPLARRYGY